MTAKVDAMMSKVDHLDSREWDELKKRLGLVKRPLSSPPSPHTQTEKMPKVDGIMSRYSALNFWEKREFKDRLPCKKPSLKHEAPPSGRFFSAVALGVGVIAITAIISKASDLYKNWDWNKARSLAASVQQQIQSRFAGTIENPTAETASAATSFCVPTGDMPENRLVIRAEMERLVKENDCDGLTIIFQKYTTGMAPGIAQTLNGTIPCGNPRDYERYEVRKDTSGRVRITPARQQDLS